MVTLNNFQVRYQCSHYAFSLFNVKDTYQAFESRLRSFLGPECDCHDEPHLSGSPDARVSPQLLYARKSEKFTDDSKDVYTNLWRGTPGNSTTNITTTVVFIETFLLKKTGPQMYNLYEVWFAQWGCTAVVFNLTL